VPRIETASHPVSSALAMPMMPTTPMRIHFRIGHITTGGSIRSCMERHFLEHHELVSSRSVPVLGSYGLDIAFPNAATSRRSQSS
jgi:hypothetical protein